jgi:hypothetical protein
MKVLREVGLMGCVSVSKNRYVIVHAGNETLFEYPD